MKRTLFGVIFTTAFLYSAFATAQHKVDETFSDIDEVEVEGRSANVKIVGKNTDKVRLTGEIQADDDDDDYKIRYEKDGDVLKVWIEKPNKSWSWSWGSNKGESFIRLEVPVKTEVNVENSSGNVQVENIDESVTVEASSGNVDIKDVKGRLRAEASSGNVYISDVKGNVTSETSSGRQTISDIDGDLESKASSGSIRVSEVKGRMELETSSGEIKLDDVKGKLKAKSTSGGISGSEVALTGDSEFKSTSGSIRIDLSNDIEEVDFDLHGSSGSLKAGSSQGKGDLVINNRGKIKVYGKSSSGSQRYY